MRPSTPTLAALLALVAAGTATPQSTPTAPGDPPVPIILDAPGSLDELWERLRSPDYVLLRGDRYRDLLGARPKPASAEGGPVVESVAIRGRVDRATADLELQLRVWSSSADPAWVPIRLDGLVLTSATEGERAAPIRPGERGAWEAEVRGKGSHPLRVAFATHVVASGEDRRLDFALPLAAATTLDVEVGDDPAEVSLGPGEPVVPVKVAGRGGARIEAALRPRSRLELRWRAPDDPASRLPPLLNVQTEVAVDVSPDAIRTRTRWRVSSIRGVTSSIVVALDGGDEPVEIDLDGRPIAIDADPDGKSSTVEVPLPEPLRAGGPVRSLTLQAVRRIGPGSPSRATVLGPAIRGARVQGGAVAVTQAGPIWVEAAATRGLQRIDPASDLPSDLRSHPGTVLAYRIVDRTIGLDLTIDRSPPRVEVRSSATIVLRPGSSATESRLDVRTTPGRVFELAFPLGEGARVEPPEPDEVVEAARVVAPAGGGPGSLVVRLTAAARESGAFSLTLRSDQPLPAGGGVSRSRLPWPAGAEGFGGRVEVVSDPAVEARLGGGDAAAAFSRSAAPGRGDWPWPADRHADIDPSPLWLVFGGRPDSVPLDLSISGPSYRSDIAVVAEVGRAGIDYREAVTLEVVRGRLDRFDLLVPPEVDLGWTIDGLGVEDRSAVEDRPDGSRRYRVVLAKKGAGRVSFGLRYATRFEPPLEGTASRSGRFALIRPLPEPDGPLRLSYSARPGVGVAVVGDGWEGRSPRSLYRAGSAGPLPPYEVSGEAASRLPDLLVSRAFLRTVRGSEESRTSAHYRVESHGPSVVVSLPRGARWIQARVDGETLRDVERTESPEGYRCALGPAGGAGPVALLLEYALPASAPAPWEPPLLEGAVFESCFWEVVVSNGQAVLGTPAGWSDENRWTWANSLWKRAPTSDDADLIRWVSGAAGGGVEDAPAWRANQHAYLFGRPDGPARLPVTIVPRSVLVMACSGAVALAGIGLVVLRRPWRPYVVLGIALAATLAASWAPNLTLQAIPSGLLGLLLTGVAAVLQWVVNRRRAGAVGRFASAGEASTAGSTAIRPRLPAPPDHRVISARAVPPESAASVSERG